MRKLEEMEEIESKIRIYTLRNDEEKINEWTEKKNRLSEIINQLDDRFKNFSKSNCCICLNKIEEPVIEQNCSNMFCGSLIILTIKNSCPICKTQQQQKD